MKESDNIRLIEQNEVTSFLRLLVLVSYNYYLLINLYILYEKNGYFIPTINRTGWLLIIYYYMQFRFFFRFAFSLW